MPRHFLPLLIAYYCSCLYAQSPSLHLQWDTLVQPYCSLPNGVAQVLATGGEPPYTYQWIPAVAGSQPWATFLDAGKYAVIVTDKQGHQQRISTELHSIPPPHARISLMAPALDEVVALQPPVQFLNRSTGATHYLWNFGDGVMTNGYEPLHRYSDTGTFTIVLFADDGRGECPSFDTLRVRILPEIGVYAPSAFSPNGDQTNDLFSFVGMDIEAIQVQIFDAKEQVVAAWDTIHGKWDGRMPDGSPAPEGLYHYVMRATLASGFRIENTGTITLIR